MNENEIIYKILFDENKKDKYRYNTYRINKVRLNEYGKYLDKNIVDKLNVNVEYTVNDIYTIFEKQIPAEQTFKDLINYLEYRDVFHNYTEWIIMLKKILELLHINDYTILVKKTNIGVCLDLNSDEQSVKELHHLLVDVFAEIGVIIKDKISGNINPSFFKIFGINEDIKIDKPTKIITTKKDINFNEFFPGKSNGRIVRYLKIFKMIPTKPDYDKNVFRKELLDTGFVEVKKNEIYYKKECIDGLKQWIADKILNNDVCD